MIRIIYIIDTISSDKAGTEKQLLEIIRRIDLSIFEPRLVCLYASPWMKNHTLPCPIHVLGYRGILKLNLPAVIAKLAQLVREFHVDIIQTFFEDAIFIGWLGAMFSRRNPVLLSCRRDMGLGQDVLWYHFLFKAARSFVNHYF